MNKFLLAATLMLTITGCSTIKTERYTSHIENQIALKKISGKKSKIILIDTAMPKELDCRLVGPIHTPDDLSISQYVQKAFNDELKLADRYTEEGGKISGKLTKIDFSSGSPFSDGYWHLVLALRSENQQEILIEERYDFATGFSGGVACMQTGQAISPAVQNLIKKAITHPDFEKLIQ